jgi:biotin synthase
MITDEPLLFDAPLSRSEIMQFLKEDDLAALAKLYTTADDVRALCVGEDIHVRALINFSNHCRRNCLYCGLRQGNAELTRFRMSEQEIISAAAAASEKGYRTVVLQSGEDPWYTEDIICRIIDGIKEACDMAVTLSVGEHPYKTLKAWFNEGADRYLLKHETSDPDLYEQLHPDLRFEDRIDTLRNLKEIGYQTGSGIMVGIPGQTYESVAEDILLFKELDIDMIGCGPYIHNPKTPLATMTPDAGHYIQPEPEYVYKVVALTRIVTRDTMIPATTALSVLNPDLGVLSALSAGANVVMINETPEQYRRLYEIYPRGETAVTILSPESPFATIESMTGRPVSRDYGHRHL